MKSLSAIEKGVLLLAGVFIIAGVYTAIYPTEISVSHPGSGRYQSIIGQDPPAERVSPEKSRIYGIIVAGLGIGIAWLVFYRPPK